VDHEFLDPADCYFIYGQAPPTSKGHSGYWADARVWKQINALAASGKGIPPIRSVAEPTLASDGEGAGRAGVARADLRSHADGRQQAR
jgi:hypothetical protein